MLGLKLNHVNKKGPWKADHDDSKYTKNKQN